MYNLELLRKFCIVAKHRNFTRASEELYISQPALSKSIKQLEDEMGLELLKRTKKSVELTKEGLTLYHMIYPKIEYICNIDTIIGSFKNKETVNLRIGANATVTRNILTPVLKSYLNDHPNVNIMIKNKSTFDLVKLLQQKELDFLIINLPIGNITGLDIIEIKKTQDVFIAGNKYDYLKNESITINQLQSLPIIVNSTGSVVREHFEKYCIQNEVSITPFIESVRNSLMLDFCALGLGIGFTTYEFIEKEIEAQGLFVLHVEPPVPPRSVGIVTRNEPKPEFIQDFIKVLKGNH